MKKFIIAAVLILSVGTFISYDARCQSYVDGISHEVFQKDHWSWLGTYVQTMEKAHDFCVEYERNTYGKHY